MAVFRATAFVASPPSSSIRAGSPPGHTVFTPPGPRPVNVSGGDGSFRIEVDLGTPELSSDGIPMVIDPPRDRVVDFLIEVLGEQLQIAACSMGNPHCCVFVDEPAD